MTTKKNTRRLSRTFHKTFKPERHYISALLRFSASGQDGDFQEIARATGIPMGTSSGKVPAIIEYSKGMGLVKATNNTKSNKKNSLELTDFGRIVLFEDPYLKYEITQWIAHFNLCNPIFGADIWYYTFFLGSKLLGERHKRKDLENYLSMQYGIADKNLIGPLVGMYDDEASFSLCGAIKESRGTISKREAPILPEHTRGYGAWLIQLIADNFPKQKQVLVSDLESIAGWESITRWSKLNSQLALDLFERKGIIDVDRHMNPWIIQPRMSPDQAWKGIFDDIL